MTVIPFDQSFARAMDGVAADMKRRTHIVVARSLDTGEVRSWQARPRGEALDYRDAQRIMLGDRWKVRAVRVRRRFR